MSAAVELQLLMDEVRWLDGLVRQIEPDECVTRVDALRQLDVLAQARYRMMLGLDSDDGLY